MATVVVVDVAAPFHRRDLLACKAQLVLQLFLFVVHDVCKGSAYRAKIQIYLGFSEVQSTFDQRSKVLLFYQYSMQKSKMLRMDIT